MKVAFARRQHVSAGAAVVILVFAAASSCQRSGATRDNEMREVTAADRSVSKLIVATTDSLDASLAALSAAVRDASNRGSDSAQSARVRKAFNYSRAQYKHLEAVAEFYAPALAAALNSRRQEVDDDDAPPPASLAPGGYPAIEQMLWVDAAIDAEKFDTTVIGMRRVVAKLRDIGAALAPTDAQLIELGRLELARISTLSIAGFDTPVTLRAAEESADALVGLREVFEVVDELHWSELKRERANFDSLLRSSAEYLNAHADFETFDRLAFIVRCANPTAHALDDLRKAARVVPVGIKRGWRADVASVYDSNAFDARVYAADNAPPSTPALVRLGEQLFNDPVLSGNGSRACSSCHVPSHAFTDGLPRAARVDGHGVVARHTPTLLNAAFSPAQFADERAPSIEEQVIRVVESPTEMAGSLEKAAALLSANTHYTDMFGAAYGQARRAPKTGGANVVTANDLRFAIAAYVRSLSGLGSRFDRAVRGDTSLLTVAERRGFNLFMGKAGCGTCHFAPLFNGNTPPLYVAADVEVIGVPVNEGTPAVTDPDSGRAAIDGLPLHYRAFKTPTVRNAAQTAPFMHNGAFRSLDEVIRFYSDGGGVGAGSRIPNQTLGSKHLNLTAPERNAIIAFIGSLTDTTYRISRK